MTERLLHLPLPVTVEGLAKKRGGGHSEPEKKRGDAERAAFGKKVLDESDRIIESLLKWKDKYGDKIDPALIFKIEANSPINESDLDRMGLKVLGTDYKDTVVVFADDEHLTEFKRMMGEHSGEIPPNQKNAKYAFIHAFEDIRKVTPDEKKGVRLKKEPLKGEEIAILDIELWHLGEEYRRQIVSWKDGIGKILKDRGGEITDFYPGRALFIIRAKVPSSVLDEILNMNQVVRVDRPPKVTIDMVKVKGLSLGKIGKIPSPEDDAPGILIIDSGIMSGHPLLNTAIGDSQSYLDGKSAVDEAGHGTAVAAVALYGDLQQCVDEVGFTPELWIYSARVCDENGDYDEEKLPETQLRDAIEYFVGNYENIRVVNLSIGDIEEVHRSEGKQFRLAAAIDELAFDYKDNNIMFVVSAGNYKNSKTGVEYLDEEIASRYPSYLLDDPNAKIIDPATSALALTVGSLALGHGSAYKWYSPTLAGFEEFPAPFTRAGPGMNEMVKPDLVELGGDLTFERGSGVVTDSSIGIITAEKDFLSEGLLTIENGTSFSAAKVSHLAARLWKDIPNASSNLIKALLVASARIPELKPPPFDSLDLKGGSSEEQSKLLNIYGYGLPNLDRAFPISTRVLLIDERKLKLNDIAIYEIPVPTEFYRGTGRRIISITLAFDPPTRKTRKQYLGATMNFHLFRDVTVEEVKQKYAEMEIYDTDEERTLPKEITLIPGASLTKKGTIQKRMWVMDGTIRQDIDESLKLVVICSDKWMNDEEYRQKYAIVATVEHRSIVDLYNIMEARVRTRPRVRI